jgi:hypothetical protein
VIHFGSIQNYMNYSHVYDAYIGVSCDSFNWMMQLNKGSNQYCVLHGTVDERTKAHYKERVCWVSPMHPCYFIPSDLPQFKRETFHKGDKLRLCLKGSTPAASFQYVVEGARLLLREPNNIEIIVMGRNAEQMPEVFRPISPLVTLGKESDYYKFEEMMSKCHALLPLIHPWEEFGKKYFPWSGAGKLSGYMSQAVGLKLPLLVHNEIRELYQEHLDAPVWSYTTQNASDTRSFIESFRAMMKELPDYLVKISAE